MTTTETTSYGKPVTAVSAPTADFLTSADRVMQEGPKTLDGTFGVIVYRTDDRAPSVHYCDTTEYRDNTLVPFFTYYDSVKRVETF